MLRLAAEHLLPGEGRHIELPPIDLLGEHRRGRVADGQPRAVAGDPIGIGHAHARGRAVPGEHHVAVAIDLGEIGQLAIRREQRAHVLELELLDDVGDPIAAERLPGEHVDAAGAEQRPQRHLHRAGVRRRHDRHAVIGRQASAARRVRLMRKLEPRLRLGAPVVAADQRALERLDRPAGMLGARPRREARIVGADYRLVVRGHRLFMVYVLTFRQHGRQERRYRPEGVRFSPPPLWGSG